MREGRERERRGEGRKQPTNLPENAYPFDAKEIAQIQGLKVLHLPFTSMPGTRWTLFCFAYLSSFSHSLHFLGLSYCCSEYDPEVVNTFIAKAHEIINNEHKGIVVHCNSGTSVRGEKEKEEGKRGKEVREEKRDVRIDHTDESLFWIGRNRAGTMLALYLLHHFPHFTAAEAIACVREKRPGSITEQQEAIVQQYWQYLQEKKQ